MKQALFILAMFLGTTLAACGGSGEEPLSTTKTATRANVAATPAPEPTPTAVPEQEVPETATPEPTPAPTPTVEPARKQTPDPTHRGEPVQEPQPETTAEELGPKPETDQPHIHRKPGGATSTPGAPAPTPRTDEAILTQKKPLKYPKLGSRLNDMAVRAEEGETSNEDIATAAPLHRNGSVAVTIHLSQGPDNVAAFLSEHGGDPRNLGEDYIEAYVPVSLLGQLSEQHGVTRVREITPPNPGRTTKQTSGRRF